MNLALALAMNQIDNTIIVVAVVVVILLVLVLVIGIGLTIFFVMRKRSKAQKMVAPSAPAPAPVLAESPAPELLAEPAPEVAPVIEQPPVAVPDPAEQETRWPASSDLSPAAVNEPEATDFDPSRTVAIVREPTVEISYGKIKFITGVLTGEEFPVDASGTYIGREPSLSQIVVSDPRISKRHLWIGVRDGAVMIVDQESRNGTFINDPRSERVHEVALNSGDIVIMGESDVARFEFNA